MKEKTSNSMNQWLALNRILFVYKIMGLAAIVLALALTCIVFHMANSDPIVVVDKGGQKSRFVGKRMPSPLTASEIENLIQSYVYLRYEWEGLNSEKLTKSISPFVTKGFLKKTKRFLRRMKRKEFKDKSLSQNVSRLSVVVDKDSTKAKFDRVLRVEGVPLIVPTQVSFNLVRDEKTLWNPLGLYINGVKVHEGQ